nr:spermatogenesis-associated protein 31A5-like [Loxodonta africana]
MQAWIYRPECAKVSQLPNSNSAFQIMENYPCPLKSASPAVLSSCCTSWATDIFLTILCAVGLFLLLLFYPIQRNPHLPLPKKNINLQKRIPVAGAGLVVLSPEASWESHLTRAAFISGKVENPLARLEEEHLLKPGGGHGGVRSSVQSPRQMLLPRCPPPLPRRLRPSPRAIWPPPLRKTTPESFSGKPYYSVSSVSTVTGPDGSSRPVSACSWWWAAAKTFPLWKHCKSQQEHTSQHPSKASFWGVRTDGSIEPGSPSLLNPDVQKPLEIAIAKRVESKIWKEKKHVSSDYCLNSSRLLKSLSHEQATTVPQPYWSKAEQLSSPQQLIYPEALGEHLLPSLHSESLGAAAWVSGSSPPVQSPVLFNRISNASPVQVSSQCSQPSPLRPNPRPHLWSQSSPRPLSNPLHQSHHHLLLQPRLGPMEYFALVPKMKHKLSSQPKLGTFTLRGQRAFSPLNPNLPQASQASEARKSDSILPGDVPSRTELWKQLEQHIQKRVTQHKQSLPSRKRESLELTHMNFPPQPLMNLGPPQELRLPSSGEKARRQAGERRQQRKSQTPFRIVLSLPPHLDIAAWEVVSELMVARGSSLGQQDPKIPKLQDPWKNQWKISAPTDERKVFGSCKPKEHEEGLAGLGAYRARGVSQPARDKREAPEVQTLTKAVGQILEEKLRFQQASYASELKQQTEKTQVSQDPVGGRLSYRKASSYPEHRREMSDMVRNKCTHEGHRNPYAMVKFKTSDRTLPSRGPVSPVSPCQHGPRMWGASGCHHHSTFCHREGVSYSQPAFFGRNIPPM